MDPKQRDEYYDALLRSTVFKQVVATSFTGTTFATLWAPATGKKFKLKGVSLQLGISTTLAGSPSDLVALFDNANNNSTAVTACPLVNLSLAGTNAAGTSFGTIQFFLREGYTSAAINNTLRIGSYGTIGAGVIRVVGVVFGDEV